MESQLLAVWEEGWQNAICMSEAMLFTDGCRWDLEHKYVVVQGLTSDITYTCWWR